MGMNNVGAGRSAQSDQGRQRAKVSDWRPATAQGKPDNTESVSADFRKQRTFGAGTDHFVSARAGAAHQWPQEMAQGKIDIDHEQDLHRGPGAKATWRINRPS